MKVKTIRVSDKGQISIPLDIREEVGIKKGDELILIESNGKILLEKQEKASNKLKSGFKDILKFSEDSLKSVWDNKQDDIWNKYLKNES